MKNISSNVDVVIIGAGPSGSVAAGLLVQQGLKVLVLEKQVFPRFSIGESLLPQCMAFIEKAGFMNAVQKAAEPAGFQFKNGAAFQRHGEYEAFNFEEKFTPGWGTTFQVERGSFDKVLIDEAEAKGAEVHYQVEVIDVVTGGSPSVLCRSEAGSEHRIECKFILDASGFGRVLPRLLDIEEPSDFPVRRSVFTHVRDNIDSQGYDRSKILVTVHPENEEVWYWLIPFSDGRCSLGIVAEPSWFEKYGDNSDVEILQTAISEDPYLSDLLANAIFDFPARQLTGYSCNVKQMFGEGYALLGNAGEFLDPVFSSGVTIAMYSADLAVTLLAKQFNGDVVDWQSEYAEPLGLGVNTFRTFVDTWYNGKLQSIIFSNAKSDEIKEMISSILAGYAWDTSNPYVADSRRKMSVLAKVCQSVYS
ncbi:FAD-dependent oxidoreductase [Gammaproteobacteria bacterium 45_16_T64]|nr:FAD-dependent oxidoreductase [Gammaproteobacteria bacterium 45_16_T64]